MKLNKENFRKQIDSDYKSYRKGIRKPVCYKALRDWVIKTYPSKVYKNLEADDTIGILATGEYKNKCIIISGDKDMRTIPANHIGLDADDVIEDIRLWNEQNGNKKKYANLNAFYMNWCRKEARRKPKAVVKVQSHQKDGKVAVRAEKELSQPQKDLIQSWIDQVHNKAKTNPSEYGGVNYDKLRDALTTSMKFQFANWYGETLTTRQICDKFDLNKKN